MFLQQSSSEEFIESPTTSNLSALDAMYSVSSATPSSSSSVPVPSNEPISTAVTENGTLSSSNTKENGISNATESDSFDVSTDGVDAARIDQLEQATKRSSYVSCAIF